MALRIPLLMVVLCWAIFYIDLTHPAYELYTWGIQPRTLTGLRGIFAAVFLHSTSDFSHIINNTTPLLFLGWALFYFYREMAWTVLFGIWGISGFWVWLSAGGSNYHIGASGLLYGLAAFLFFSGVLRRHTQLMGLTLLIVFLYGGMIWGIFPYDIRISWESHLFGSIAGAIFAVFYRRKGIQRTRYEWENEPQSESFAELNRRHEQALVQPQPDENTAPENTPASPSSSSSEGALKITWHYREKKSEKKEEEP